MVTDRPWEPSRPGDGRQVGYVQTREFDRYLAASERGWTVEERLFQLEEMDSRMAAAIKLQRKGWSTRDIAAALEVHVRTAQVILRRARDFLLEGSGEPGSPERAVAELLVSDPLAFRAWVLRSYRHTLESAAALLDKSEDQVKRASAKASAVLGPPDREIARRYRREIREERERRDRLAAAAAYRQEYGEVDVVYRPVVVEVREEAVA
jgi:hypothetical protein